MGKMRPSLISCGESVDRSYVDFKRQGRGGVKRKQRRGENRKRKECFQSLNPLDNLFDPQRNLSGANKPLGEETFTSSFYMQCQFSQHHLLKKLSLPHGIFLPPLSKIRYPQVHGFISGLSILFHDDSLLDTLAFLAPSLLCSSQPSQSVLSLTLI